MAGNMFRPLADGQLPILIRPLYTCPVNTNTEIVHISLVNTNSAAITINLYVKRDGTNNRQITPVDLSIAAYGKFVMDEHIGLEYNDTLEGDASTADKVDYVIDGIEYISAT